MKVSEAEKKICPFIQSCIDIEDYSDDIARNISCMASNCMASNCMAWVHTKIDASFEIETETCRCGESTNKHSLCQRCETRAGEGSWSRTTTYDEDKSLEDKDKEGYCQRLKT